MLKRIALFGFFVLASATPGVSKSSSTSPATKSQVEAPTKPAPQGFCGMIFC
jgi:hypothetical protein